MKKLFFAVAVASMFAACGGSTSVKSEQDSLAYAVGLDLGNYIKNMDSTMNVDLVASAIKDVINNDAQLTQEDAHAFLTEYFTVRKPAKAKEASDKFLADIETQSNVKKTESGLLYEVILEGDKSAVPVGEDVVKVVYEGKLKNGVVFDSSKERGDTVEFALNQVIKGWGEGLQLVGKGGKIKLWIPAELGYGTQGAGQQIGPNEALVFEVDLIDVIPAKK